MVVKSLKGSNLINFSIFNVDICYIFVNFTAKI